MSACVPTAREPPREEGGGRGRDGAPDHPQNEEQEEAEEEEGKDGGDDLGEHHHHHQVFSTQAAHNLENNPGECPFCYPHHHHHHHQESNPSPSPPSTQYLHHHHPCRGDYPLPHPPHEGSSSSGSSVYSQPVGTISTTSIDRSCEDVPPSLIPPPGQQNPCPYHCRESLWLAPSHPPNRTLHSPLRPPSCGDIPDSQTSGQLPFSQRSKVLKEEEEAFYPSGSSEDASFSPAPISSEEPPPYSQLDRRSLRHVSSSSPRSMSDNSGEIPQQKAISSSDSKQSSVTNASSTLMSEAASAQSQSHPRPTTSSSGSSKKTRTSAGGTSWSRRERRGIRSSSGSGEGQHLTRPGTSGRSGSGSGSGVKAVGRAGSAHWGRPSFVGRRGEGRWKWTLGQGADHPLTVLSVSSKRRRGVMVVLGTGAGGAQPASLLAERRDHHVTLAPTRQGISRTSSSPSHGHHHRSLTATGNGHGKTTQGHDKTTQGHDKTTQGHDKATQGHDKAIQGHDKAIQGHDKATQGHDKATQGHGKTSEGHDKATQGHGKTSQGLSLQDPRATSDLAVAHAYDLTQAFTATDLNPDALNHPSHKEHPEVHLSAASTAADIPEERLLSDSEGDRTTVEEKEGSGSIRGTPSDQSDIDNPDRIPNVNQGLQSELPRCDSNTTASTTNVTAAAASTTENINRFLKKSATLMSEQLNCSSHLPSTAASATALETPSTTIKDGERSTPTKTPLSSSGEDFPPKIVPTLRSGTLRETNAAQTKQAPPGREDTESNVAGKRVSSARRIGKNSRARTRPLSGRSIKSSTNSSPSDDSGMQAEGGILKTRSHGGERQCSSYSTNSRIPQRGASVSEAYVGAGGMMMVVRTSNLLPAHRCGGWVVGDGGGGGGERHSSSGVGGGHGLSFPRKGVPIPHHHQQRSPWLLYQRPSLDMEVRGTEFQRRPATAPEPALPSLPASSSLPSATTVSASATTPTTTITTTTSTILTASLRNGSLLDSPASSSCVLHSNRRSGVRVVFKPSARSAVTVRSTSAEVGLKVGVGVGVKMAADVRTDGKGEGNG